MTTHLACHVLLWVLASASLAAQVQWTPVRSWPTAATGAVVYDEARQRVVWVGAQSESTDWEAWEWNGTAWQFRSRTGSAVTNKLPLAYDAARRRTVLFGAGPGGVGTRLSEWNGEQWFTLQPAQGPSPRFNHALAYDAARQRVVLFGGNSTGGPSLDDTWTWDGNAWTFHGVVPRPSPRTNTAMAFDEARARVVLFAGRNGNLIGNDTWLWDGSSWQASSAPRPPGRADAGIAWHRGRQRIVVAGGVSPTSTLLADVWEWDGTAWSNSLPSLPEARQGPGLVYDAAAGRLLLVAGTNYGVRSDTWALNATAWQRLVPQQAPDNLVGDATLAIDPANGRALCLVSSSPVLPSPLAYRTFAHDGTSWNELATTASPVSVGRLATATDLARARIVAVGGLGGGTFEWTGTDWVNAGNPPVALDFALATDPVSQRVLLFGGSGSTGAVNSLWEWDGSLWTQRQPASSPPARFKHAMATDTVSGRVVLFGGSAPGQLFRDTWLFDGTNWTQAQPATLPPARSGHAMTFDWSRNAVVMSGGTNGMGPDFGDLWSWNGSDWVAVPVAPGTNASGHSLAFGPVAQRLLLIFGGAEFRPMQLLTFTSAGAAATAGSPGCGVPAAPRLTSDLPYLGNSACELELAANASSACLFAVSLTAQTTPIGGGCFLYVGGNLSLQFAVANGSGVARARIPVPYRAVLRGMVAHAQAVTLDPLGPFSGLAFSNSWRLTVAD
jgi:hypothetical protein